MPGTKRKNRRKRRKLRFLGGKKKQKWGPSDTIIITLGPYFWNYLEGSILVSIFDEIRKAGIRSQKNGAPFGRSGYQHPGRKKLACALQMFAVANSISVDNWLDSVISEAISGLLRLRTPSPIWNLFLLALCACVWVCVFKDSRLNCESSSSDTI